MKYFEANFTIHSANPLQLASVTDICDLLAALAGEAGFETFEETPTGLKGYVQQVIYDEAELKRLLSDFPFEGVTIDFELQEAENKDWNEQWEHEGFKPIIVNGSKQTGKSIVIHDGRHLPERSTDTIDIEIDAHMAFGTGTHETTRMICSTLLDLDLKGLRILDCGTGTGILAICALKLGADEAVGYDIDEWSVDNARHNTVINQVDSRFTSLLGDVHILNKVEGTFSLILANINRNILLNDMASMKRKMAHGARLILSGFYTSDIAILEEKAKSLGLSPVNRKEDNGWACLELLYSL